LAVSNTVVLLQPCSLIVTSTKKRLKIISKIVSKSLGGYKKGCSFAALFFEHRLHTKNALEIILKIIRKTFGGYKKGCSFAARYSNK
jgi:hypothetical protein